VVKYTKKLTSMYTNLSQPKSMHLEDIVLVAEDDVMTMPFTSLLAPCICQRPVGATNHFDMLMEAVLKVRTYPAY
jgi:hypothetical protein